MSVAAQAGKASLELGAIALVYTETDLKVLCGANAVQGLEAVALRDASETKDKGGIGIELKLADLVSADVSAKYDLKLKRTKYGNLPHANIDTQTPDEENRCLRDIAFHIARGCEVSSLISCSSPISSRLSISGLRQN